MPAARQFPEDKTLLLQQETEWLQQIEACLQRYALTQPTIKLMVAVSGGADSMALALLLQQWARQWRTGAQVHAAIVDHGLRAESASEAAQTQACLHARDIPARVLRLEVKSYPQSNIQATARQWRFEALLAHAQTIDAAAIVLGHNCGDQAETVIDRLARGSHMVGLSGMAEYRLMTAYPRAIAVLRPLLSLEPAQLRRYCEQRQCAYVCDPSNHDRRFRRVRLRQMLAQRPGLQRAALRLQRIASQQAGIELAAARYYWQQCVQRPCSSHDYGLVMIDPALFDAPLMVQWRILGSVLRYVAQRDYPPRHDQLQRLCHELKKARHASAQQQWQQKRSLAGAIISYTSAGLLVYREAAALPPPRTLTAEQTFCWDHRLSITAHTTVIIRAAKAQDLEKAQTTFPPISPFLVSSWRYKPHLLCLAENIHTGQCYIIPPHMPEEHSPTTADIDYQWQPKVIFGQDLHKSGLLFSTQYPIC